MYMYVYIYIGIFAYMYLYIYVYMQGFTEPSRKVDAPGAYSFLPERRREFSLYSARVEREQLHLGLKSVIFALRVPRSKIIWIKKTKH